MPCSASGQGVNANPQIWVYRNTLLGSLGALDLFPYTVDVEQNVVVNPDAPHIPPSGSAADGIVDTDDNLTGTSRTDHLGTHGWEIAP